MVRLPFRIFFSFLFLFFSSFSSFPPPSPLVWEVAFHPTQPNDALSCSEDGTVGFTGFGQGFGSSSSEPKYFNNILASKLSVNSFDVAEDLLVYGTDNECLVFSLVS